jgi:hypothetical protein
MDIDLSGVELGFLVNLKILRQVLKGLSTQGRRWWIACDPMDALQSQSVTVGHGDANCTDRLNTMYFKVPVLNEERPVGGNDRLVLLLEPSVISPEQPGLYLEDGQVLKDDFTDAECFYEPIRKALNAMLQES